MESLVLCMLRMLIDCKTLCQHCVLQHQLHLLHLWLLKWCAAISMEKFEAICITQNKHFLIVSTTPGRDLWGICGDYVQSLSFTNHVQTKFWLVSGIRTKIFPLISHWNPFSMHTKLTLYKLLLHTVLHMHPQHGGLLSYLKIWNIKWKLSKT